MPCRRHPRRDQARPAGPAPAALFELGNLATTLLILRATDLLHTDQRSLTAATSLAILLYAAHNAAATVASLAGGQIANRLSPRIVFAYGAAAYALGYLLFAVTQHSWPVLLIGFLLADIGIAETAESTVVAQALPEHLRGNGPHLTCRRVQLRRGLDARLTDHLQRARHTRSTQELTPPSR
jgi:MFS family permease